MTNVYVVTAGDYSAYHVVALFTDTQQAQTLAQYVGGRVEMFPLDPPVIVPTLPRFEIQMLRSGNVQYAGPIQQERWIDEETLHPYASTWHLYKGNPQYLMVTCFARSIEHAVKIANELRIQTVTLGLWEMLSHIIVNMLMESDVDEAVRQQLNDALAHADDDTLA